MSDFYHFYRQTDSAIIQIVVLVNVSVNEMHVLLFMCCDSNYYSFSYFQNGFNKQFCCLVHTLIYFLKQNFFSCASHNTHNQEFQLF